MKNTWLIILVYLITILAIFSICKDFLVIKKNKDFLSFKVKNGETNPLSGIVKLINLLAIKIGAIIVRVFKLKDLDKFTGFIDYCKIKSHVDLNAEAILGYKYLLSVLIFAAGILFFRLNLPGLFISLVCSLLGFFLPELIMKRINRAKIREINKDIPYIIDLLYVAALSGQNLYNAIKIVTQNYSSVICLEFEDFLKDIDKGLGKKNAYERILERNNSKQVKGLVTLLMQTEHYGCQASDLLRQKSAFLKFENLNKINQKIKIVNLKLLFPIIFLILPAFILLVGGPVFYLLGGDLFFSK
jgi:hypothetical protein